MANTFIPFDNNPVNTEIKDNASYTVPSGKFAKIRVLAYSDSDSSMAYDVATGGASSAEISEYTNVDTAPTTSSPTFVTAYTVPNGCFFDGQITLSHSATAATARARVGSGGYPFHGSAVTATPQAGSSDIITIPVKLGPGGIIQHLAFGASGTTTTHISGCLRKTSIGSVEFFLKSGDQITFPGVILIQEYNNIT